LKKKKQKATDFRLQASGFRLKKKKQKATDFRLQASG
jgi:hypothetical protein